MTALGSSWEGRAASAVAGQRCKTLFADVDAATLGTDDVSPCGRHIARGMPRSPADLLAHRCIRVRLPRGAIYKWQFEVDVEGPLTLDDAGLVQAAVLEGAGLGFLIEPDVRDDLASGHLIRVPPDWTRPRLNISLYYSSRRKPGRRYGNFHAAVARPITTEEDENGQ